MSDVIDKLREERDTDPLTRLHNRRSFEVLAEREIPPRQGQPLSVLLCDIDHFKHINDTHGHAAGDTVLSEFGHRSSQASAIGTLQAASAAKSSPSFCPAPTLRARCTAERLRHTLETTAFEALPGTCTVTASFGVTALTAGESLDDLLTRRHAALHRQARGKELRGIRAQSATGTSGELPPCGLGRIRSATRSKDDYQPTLPENRCDLSPYQPPARRQLRLTPQAGLRMLDRCGLAAARDSSIHSVLGSDPRLHCIHDGTHRRPCTFWRPPPRWPPGLGAKRIEHKLDTLRHPRLLAVRRLSLRRYCFFETVVFAIAISRESSNASMAGRGTVSNGLRHPLAATATGPGTAAEKASAHRSQSVQSELCQPHRWTSPHP